MMPGPAAWRVGGFRARDRQIAAPDHPGDEPDDRGADGQFFPNRLINVGTNRWGFKPEFAVSHPVGERWLIDAYAGLWLFTSNHSFYPGTLPTTAGAHRRVPGARQLQHHAADDGRVSLRLPPGLPCSGATSLARYCTPFQNRRR